MALPHARRARVRLRRSRRDRARCRDRAPRRRRRASTRRSSTTDGTACSFAAGRATARSSCPDGVDAERAGADPRRHGRRLAAMQHARSIAPGASSTAASPRCVLIHAVARAQRRARRTPIRIIALYTEPERDAMFVRHADEAVALGPRDRRRRRQRTGAYLDDERLERALLAPTPTPSGSAGASSPSIPRSRDLCEELGIVFVGPTATSCACSATRSQPS